MLAWLGQYCLLGSELWFLVIVHDLASSVDNPFSSYKLRATQYARAVHGVAFVVATLLVTVGGGARGGLLAITHHAQYGGTVSGFVWIQYSHSLFQPATWLCFYLWLAAALWLVQLTTTVITVSSLVVIPASFSISRALVGHSTLMQFTLLFGLLCVGAPTLCKTARRTCAEICAMKHASEVDKTS